MNKKFGIISYPDSRNVGDEIQSIAASRHLKSIDYFVPRDAINSFKSNNNEIVNLICNGWFTTNTKAWPPSKDINPLFVSFHATKDNGSHDIIISENYKDYYKQFEPIGCRDKDTRDKFLSIGIDAYFSGCITLTLDNPYGENVEREEILIVDPFVKFNYDKAYQKHCLDILIPKAYRNKVKHINHYRKKDHGLTIEEKIKESEALLNRYAKAKFIITSRIHVALPCLAMGTPVYFVDMGYNTKALRDRFRGIMDLFNVIDDSSFPMPKHSLYTVPFRKLGLYKLFKKENTINIDWENPKANPTKHIVLRDNIKKVVKEFIDKKSK